MRLAVYDLPDYLVLLCKSCLLFQTQHGLAVCLIAASSVRLTVHGWVYEES
jgi:hypothetical protein